jgi:hypothetical protein
MAPSTALLISVAGGHDFFSFFDEGGHRPGIGDKAEGGREDVQKN